MKKQIPKDTAMLIDIQYVAPKKNVPDYLYIIWRDLKDNSKHVECIPEPSIEIWSEKPELRNHDYPKDYIRIEDGDKIVCKYKDLPKVIAKEWGTVGKDLLNNFYSTRDKHYMNQLMSCPYIYGADVDIRTYYRYLWDKKFHNDLKPYITKGHFDIESDILEATVDLNSDDYIPGVSPIDMITFVDQTNCKSYTFALVGIDAPYRNKANPTEDEIRKLKLYDNRLKMQDYYYKNPDILQQKVDEYFKESYPEMEFNIYLYTSEAKMLVHFFQLINQLNLDMVSAWNIAYDMPEIIGRLNSYLLPIDEVICPKNFPNKKVKFKPDKTHFSLKDKTHFTRCTSSTIYIDSAVNYAAIRKGKSELRSLKLNDVALNELKETKLDYDAIGSIKTLSYKNWLTYLLYNIKDVLLLKDLEEKLKDMDTYYYDTYLNHNSYENAYKQTMMLDSLWYGGYRDQGKIIGINRNKNNMKRFTNNSNDDEDSYEGALVGSPELIDDVGQKIFGVKTNNIFNAAVDFDMGAFYPNTTIALNIHSTTLLCKCVVPASLFEPRGGDYKYHGITDSQMLKTNKDSFSDDISGEIFDNYQTGNVLSTCEKWLNLPGVTEMEKILREMM